MRLIAVYFDAVITTQQVNRYIPQHASKVECDILRNDKNIIGCTQPYRLVGKLPVMCDYI